jgi:hypothetical protein
MEDKARLDELKKMYELGVISQQEFEVLCKQQNEPGPKVKTSFFKSKWFYVALGFLVIACTFFIITSKDPEKEADSLSKLYVSCQIENNLAYINALYDVSEQINVGHYSFVAQIDSVLQELDAHYQNQDFNAAIIDRYAKFETLETQASENWSKTSASGREFWRLYEQKIEAHPELKKSNKQLNKLLDQINESKLSISVGSIEELNEKKQFVYNRLEGLFAMWDEEYFDPYEYFSYRVLQFFGQKNTNPTDVQLYINQQPNIGYAQFSPILETLTLKKKEGDSYIWEFANDYKYYNENTEIYLTCNKWYSIQLNNQDKIEVFKELKIENKKELSAEEYNALNMGE